MSIKITPDEAAIEELLREASVRDYVLSVCDAAAITTAQLTPSRDEDSIITQLTEDGALLGSTSSFWHWWEFGTVNSPAYAPLRRGCEAAGINLVGD